MIKYFHEARLAKLSVKAQRSIVTPALFNSVSTLIMMMTTIIDNSTLLTMRTMRQYDEAYLYLIFGLLFGVQNLLGKKGHQFMRESYSRANTPYSCFTSILRQYIDKYKKR